MKKKYIVMMLALGMLALPGCAKVSAMTNECHCTCEGCTDCVNKQTDEQSENTEAVIVRDTEPVQDEVSQTEVTVEQETQEESDTTDVVEETVAEEGSSVADLTEGEKAARKELQANLAEARDELYAMPDSLEKTQKINELDKQILENNVFDFSQISVQFFGDSITEGVGGSLDAEGNHISYVDYANDWLHAKECLKHGKGGRMFADYGDLELSFSQNMGNMYFNGADISVIFLGVNDYLSSLNNKRFGDMTATESTAGYVGAVRSSMFQLKSNYPDQQIFFVTMYDLDKKAESTYTDVKGNPTLKDYMDVLRKLAEKNGYHIIEIYNTGFMDCTDSNTKNAYLDDSIHPNDEGNRILGEHIAAELSLYFSQK